MKFCLILVALYLSISSVVFAAEPITFNSIAEVTQYGVSHNPDLKAAGLETEAASKLPQTLGGLPDPMVGIRLNGAPAQNEAYSVDQTRYLVRQDFPFLGERSHLKSLGSAEEQVAYIDYLIDRNSLIFSLESLLYNIQLNNRLLEITDKSKRQFEQLVRSVTVKYQSGLALQANVLRAQISSTRLDERRLSLRQQGVRLEQALKKMLNLPATQTVSLNFEKQSFVKVAIPDLTQSWAEKSLSVQRVAALKAREKSKVRVEKDRFLPNFSAQLEAWDTAVVGQQYSGQVMMTVPWFNARNKAELNIAKIQLESSDYALNDAINEANRYFVTLLSDIQITSEKLALYETQLLRDAELSVSSFRKAFEVDTAAFIDLFESEQTLFELESAQATLTAYYNTQISALKWQFETGEVAR